MVGSWPLDQRDTVGSRLVPSSMTLRGVGSFRYSPVPLAPVYALMPDGSGLVIADWSEERPGQLELHRLDQRGRPVDNYVVDFPPTPILVADRDAMIARGEEMAEGPYRSAERRGAPLPSRLRDAVIEGLALPEYYPPIQDIFATHAGDVWIRTMEAPNRGDWVRFGPDGRVNLRIHTPPGVRLQAANDAMIWGTCIDDLCVPYLIGYPIPGQGG